MVSNLYAWYFNVVNSSHWHTRRNWTYYSKTFVCLQESTWPALSQVLNARDRSACCVGWKRGFEAQQASLGWITSSFLWHILQDQLTWTAWLKISFALTTSARMTLDCRLVGSNAKLLTLTMCRWLCYSVNVRHSECDEPDGGKRGIFPGLPWIWISMDISMDISMCGYQTWLSRGYIHGYFYLF